MQSPHEPEQFAVTLVEKSLPNVVVFVGSWQLTDERESTPIDSDSSISTLHIFIQVPVRCSSAVGWGSQLLLGQYAVTTG